MTDESAHADDAAGIAVAGVVKRFGGRVVLDQVSLALLAGRTHVLLGGSGSGKSTLLRIIAGLLAADAGSVTVGDIAVVPPRHDTDGRLGEALGFMTQEGGLFPHLTTRDNLTLVARLRRWPRPQIDARVDELAAAVGFDRVMLERFPRQLSGGQRQRAALARALFLRPRFLLLDEPLGALDPIIRRGLQETLQALFAQLRTTVVLVTHDVGEAAFFGDTVTLLHDGKVLQHGAFGDLVERPAHPYVSEFLRSQRPPPELGAIA